MPDVEGDVAEGYKEYPQSEDRGLTNMELQQLFNVSATVIRHFFITLINFLQTELEDSVRNALMWKSSHPLFLDSSLSQSSSHMMVVMMINSTKREMDSKMMLLNATRNTRDLGVLLPVEEG